MKYKEPSVNISSREMIVAQILLVIILGCLIFLADWSFKNTGSDTAYLELQINGQRRAFEGSVSEDMTLLDALYLASHAGNIEFRYTLQPQANASILQISGINQKNYEVYLNSTKIPLDQLSDRRISVNDSAIVKTVEINH